MQNKGAIRLFAILLALVCVYQLSFTVVTKMVESDARAYAAGDHSLEREYIDSMLSKEVFNLGIKNYTYKECKERELNLGLDLKGGMNVTLEVSIADLVKALSNYSSDTTFNKAIALAQEMEKNSQEDFVTLFGKAFTKIDPNAQLASPSIFGYSMREKIGNKSTNSEVLAILQIEAQDAIDGSFNVLRTRIDKFGVTQPNIQRLENSGRILIELPGVKEPERVRKLLQGSAKLEFWETYDNLELFDDFERVNTYLRDQASLQDTSKAAAKAEKATPADEPKAEANSKKKKKGDKAEEVSEVNTEAATEGDLFSQIKADSAATDTSALTAEDAKKRDPLFSVLYPAIYEESAGKFMKREGPMVGQALVRDTAKVNAILARADVKAMLRRDAKFLWTGKAIDKAETVLQLIAIKVKSRDNVAPLSGDVVVDARMEFRENSGKPEVTMVMNNEGASVWKRMTGENVGKNVAIVLDDYVYSFPTVQGEISGGRTSITGNFTMNEAKDLATKLKAGKLPAPARIVEEALVGPSLGKEAINAGLISFVVAILLVFIFMVVYYGNSGFVANLAMFANVFFVFGVLASLGAVLTLPGIAGIVLTIGISIDSNVLIFERIREELLKGSGLRLAISEGYSHAYSSIIDSNVTSLLTGIILFVFGTGPIQGFATTLIIGIFCSLFSAIFITRMIFEGRLAKNKGIDFSTKFTEGAFKNTNFDFISKRKTFYMISGFLIILGIGSMAVRGFNYGVDFLGGRSYVVRFDEKVSANEVGSALTKVFNSVPMVKTFGGSDQLKITTSFNIDDNSADADDKVEAMLREGLDGMGLKSEIMSSQKVGPTIAHDIKVSAIWSVVFALLVIFLYILLRFRKWQFSSGAVVALFHDVLLVLSCFSLFWGILPFSLEIDQAFIAAILTVVGYSINDTVVVFDRIREYQEEHPKRAKEEPNRIINDALNSTLSRTVVTGVTTFIVLLVLFIAGGEVIRGFSFALLIGVVVGTYSSIFIATPVVIDLQRKKEIAPKV